MYIPLDPTSCVAAQRHAGMEYMIGPLKLDFPQERVFARDNCGRRRAPVAGDSAQVVKINHAV